MNDDIIPETLHQLFHHVQESAVILEKVLGIFSRYSVVYLLTNTRLVVEPFAVRSLLEGDGHQRKDL